MRLRQGQIALLTRKLKKSLPAGGGALGTIVGAALIIFIVLLLTDIFGFTDVFSFYEC
jgi:hypothetical protein